MEKKIISLGLFLTIIHSVAVFNNWYWRFRWMDIPMHFLGGVFIGMIFLWLFKKFFGYLDIHNRFLVLTVLLLGFVTLAGVFWEFYEFLYDLFISSREWGIFTNQGVQDTISDLFFDILGGFTAAVLMRSYFNKVEV